MELTISGKVAEQVLGLVKRNRPLAETVAQQLVDRYGAEKLAQFLLNEGALVDLLADRLVDEPQETLAALEDMSDGSGSKVKKAVSKPTPKAASKAPKAVSKPKTLASKPASAPRRRRLNDGQLSSLKDKIVEFLASVDAGSRKQIIENADIPTPSIYNRVINELREAGVIAARGEKAKAVYYLTQSKKTAKKRKDRRR